MDWAGRRDSGGGGMFRLERDKVVFHQAETENQYLFEGQRLFQQHENPWTKEHGGSGAKEEEEE